MNNINIEIYSELKLSYLYPSVENLQNLLQLGYSFTFNDNNHILERSFYILGRAIEKGNVIIIGNDKILSIGNSDNVKIASLKEVSFLDVGYLYNKQSSQNIKIIKEA